MATTQQYIDQLKIDKQNLVSMLNNMGVEASNNETFTSLTPKVGKIVSEPILQDKSIEITENGTTNIVADEGYDGLNNVSITANVGASGSSGGDKIAPMSISFKDYKGTEIKGLDNIDITNLTSMGSMFYGCSNITNLDLSGWNTGKVTSMYQTFRDCSKLQSLDLRSWDTSKVTNTQLMFRYCESLKYLDMRNADFSKVTLKGDEFSEIPANCEIIVKDDTVKAWVLARRSTLTNVKTVAEL